MVAYQRDRHEEAVALIEKAISIHSSEASYYSNPGLALKQLHRLQGVLASYEVAIRLNPTHRLFIQSQCDDWRSMFAEMESTLRVPMPGH